MKQKDTKSRHWQNKQYLKLGIAVLITVGICGWVIYCMLKPEVTPKYGDFAIDSAVAWLENADRGNFDVCRKSIVDRDGWFDWFVKDRESLGTIKARSLVSRREVPGAAKGMKRYELKFNSKFSVDLEHNITERIIIETDGKKQLKILMADYWIHGNWNAWKELKVNDDTKAQIMTVAEKVLKKIDSRDIAFFKRRYTEISKESNYLGRNWSVDVGIKRLLRLFRLRTEGTPSSWKFDRMGTFVPLGRTGFKSCNVWYHFSATVNGETKNFVLLIFVNSDAYQGNTPDWKFDGLGFREIKQQK